MHTRTALPPTHEVQPWRHVARDSRVRRPPPSMVHAAALLLPPPPAPDEHAPRMVSGLVERSLRTSSQKIGRARMTHLQGV